MKRITFVLFAAMIMFVMAGCSNTNEAEQETRDTAIESSATEDMEEEDPITEDAATEAPAAENSAAEDPVTPSEEAVSDSENVFRAEGFTLQLPDQWLGNCTIDSFEDEETGLSIVVFCASECYEETGDGWLFSLARYESMDYLDLPAYQVLGTQDGVAYVAIYPTDVQTEGASDTAKAQYYAVLQGVEEVVNSFQITEPSE